MDLGYASEVDFDACLLCGGGALEGQSVADASVPHRGQR